MGLEAIHFQAAFICLMGKGILGGLRGGVNGFRLPEMFCVLRVFFITHASAVFQEGGSLF